MQPDIKNIYRAHEFKFTDYLNSLRQELADDFLKNHPTWTDAAAPSVFEYTDMGSARQDINNRNSNIQDSWNFVPIKSMVTQEIYEQHREKYPTIFKLSDKFGVECTNLVYTSLDPGSMIKRHTGDENREAKNVRIHIPLIVPQGDIGMEVWGEEVRWDNVFAFNNQKTHSVWNLTSERRLIVLMDLTRKICDLPPASAWYPGCNDSSPPFPKTAVEGDVWQNSIKR